MKYQLQLLLTIFALLPPTAFDCGSDHNGHGHDDGEQNAFATVSKAVCGLSSTNNEDLPVVAGTVTIPHTNAGVLVQASVTGLKPDSKHGFHVHQWGDLSKPDGTATGGHYDPTGIATHGLPDVHDHDGQAHAMTGGHAGDFGNLQSDADGNATYAKTFEDISLTGNNAVLGRAIIVHLGEDDGGQPTGNAGARVAQGVIGIANPE